MFIDIRRSTALLERRLPYDAVFILNHFFEAVAGAIVEANGMPEPVHRRRGHRPSSACARNRAKRAATPIAAVELARARLAQMNRMLADELAHPIEIGVGVHAGPGRSWARSATGIGFLLTAIGDTVNVAARLQDLTKDHDCTLVVSQIVVDTAGADLDAYPAARASVYADAGKPHFASAQSHENGPGCPGPRCQEG